MKKEIKGIIKSVKAYMKAQAVAGIEDFYLETRPKHKSLKTLAQEVHNCRQCPLFKTRINPVFGQGDSRARLLFIGEAPGREEDRQGLPFVGRAGELLTKIIEAMGFKRKDVYICNVLKCRPPENRNPLPSEILACREYLRQQLEMIKPQIICCMGRFACDALLNQDLAIGKLRGRFQDYYGIKVMPTFHPAYLLRNPGDKKLVWEDMQKIMKELKR
jgi:DNA polymerase